MAKRLRLIWLFRFQTFSSDFFPKMKLNITTLAILRVALFCANLVLRLPIFQNSMT
jgi:hypothetical protein